MTGAEIDSVDDAIDLICSGFAGAQRVTDAVADGALGATLLVETGPGRTLVSAAARRSRMPAVSLRSGFADPMNSARVAAALVRRGRDRPAAAAVCRTASTAGRHLAGAGVHHQPVRGHTASGGPHRADARRR